MAASEKYKPKTNWNQTAFEKLKATWSPERIAEDEKTLQNIFALAADCPLLTEALEWAQQHDIKFFIDRNAVNCGAYYTLSTGVMALTAKTATDLDVTLAVGSVVHEIRHAWQDYYGLVGCDTEPFSGDYRRSFINTALIEADALAYGLRAKDQYRAALAKKRGWPVPSAIQKTLPDENADLGRKFLTWFSNRNSHTQFYGEKLSKFFGRKWDVYEGAQPERRNELSLTKLQLDGINIDNIQDVLRLGVNFSGTKNYLAAMQPDILPKRILRPWLAGTFWGTANSNQRKLTAAIRKASLKKKLVPENRKPRHPWP